MPLSETVLIIMGLLTVAMLAAGLCRKLSVPYTVVLVVVGIVLGQLSEEWLPLRFLEDVQLSPDLAGMVDPEHPTPRIVTSGSDSDGARS